MVSGGQVTSDSESLTSVLSEYDSKISSLSSSWKGSSHDNLQSKASEFSSQFSSSISSQMTSFATACDLYERYILVKENLEIAKANYEQAVSNEDSDNISIYSRNVSEFTEEKNSLKAQIESNLQSASSVSLDAGGGSGGAGVGTGSSGGSSKSVSSSSVRQGAVDWAVGVANDDSHGYSYGSRGGNPDYDCSSFVISAYENAGIPVGESGASYTGNMRSSFVDQGFSWIPGNPDVNSLEPGDVLLNESSHAEMYIGDGQLVGAHDDYDGGSGDSSGKEISVGNYYDFAWDGVLRYTGDDES